MRGMLKWLGYGLLGLLALIGVGSAFGGGSRSSSTGRPVGATVVATQPPPNIEGTVQARVRATMAALAKPTALAQAVSAPPTVPVPEATTAAGPVVAKPTEPPMLQAQPGVPTFGDGVHRVGTDLPPGTYRSRPSGNCYWERMADFTGGLQSILANGNETAPAVVTILESDAGFRSSRCGTWTQDLSPITSSPTAPFGDGTYIVGTDIASGTWRTTGKPGCYWERLGTFTGGLESILANENESGAAVVTIQAGDKGFTSRRCGTWEKIQ